MYKLVKKFNPACAVSVNQTIVTEEVSRKFTAPSDMTVDNKYFFHYFPSDFRLWDPRLVSKFDKKQYLHEGKSYYLPFEHTLCLSSRWNWFQKSVPLPVREPDELEELFYWCTDNDNALVINVPPDETGRIREFEALAVIELGKKLGLAAGKPLPRNGRLLSLGRPVTATSVWPDKEGNYAAAKLADGNLDSRWASVDTLATVEISLDPAAAFNKISIFEYKDTKSSPDGFSQVRLPRIQAYSIDIWQQGQWQTIYLGYEPMGDCKVVRLPRRYRTEKLRLKITKATGPPSIHEISVIDMPKS